ncbi:hypothetical protein [Nocardioides sp.]|uniref:hypothetical protein n=1 Tax=Nocardioides sp. TaxID=35761 RepID=UPI00351861F2
MTSSRVHLVRAVLLLTLGLLAPLTGCGEPSVCCPPTEGEVVRTAGPVLDPAGSARRADHLAVPCDVGVCVWGGGSYRGAVAGRGPALWLDDGGRRLLTAEDDAVVLHRGPALRSRTRWPLPAGAVALATVPRGGVDTPESVVAVLADGRVLVLDPGDGRVVGRPAVRVSDPSGPDGLSVDPTGRFLALGSTTGSATVVDLAGDSRPRRIGDAPTPSVSWLAGSGPGGLRLATAGESGVDVWDVADGGRTASWPGPTEAGAPPAILAVTARRQDAGVVPTLTTSEVVLRPASGAVVWVWDPDSDTTWSVRTGVFAPIGE